MSDTAQAWVWQHSRTKNTARLVLLALAREAAEDGTVRMGTADLMRAANATKGAVVDGIGRAVALGELEVTEPGAGKRAALYRLPAAEGYSPVSGREIRPLDTPSGREIRPLDLPADLSRSGNPTASPSRSGNPTATPTPSGRESGPLQLDLTDTDEHATRARASSKALKSMREGGKEKPPRLPTIPEFARPVVDTISAAGHHAIRWSLTPMEWLTVQKLIERSGPQALAAFAIDQAARRRVAHARYFLPGWRELAPAPTGDSNVIPLPPARSNGHQPFQCPPPDAYTNDLGF